MYLYQRAGSANWWARFSVNGKRLRMSTGCEGEQAARQWAKAKEGKLVTGEATAETVKVDRVKYEEARADLLSHYATHKSRDLTEAGWRLAHLDPFFSGRKLASIGPKDSTRYAATRQAEGASNASINRELAVLGRMLRVAYINGKLQRMPVLHKKLKESAPRSGFFEAEQYAAVRRHLDPETGAPLACDFSLTYGWRMRSEVLTREWRHVDLRVGTVRLDPGEAKNDDARVVYLTPELLAGFQAQRARVRELEKRLGRIVPYVFPHFTGAKRQSVGLRHVAVVGDRVKDFRRQWASAVQAAGCPGMLRHDFRRTAVRNLERKGVSRSVATKLTGHRTEAVYRRYAIVSDQDLKAASAKLAQEAAR